MAIKAVSFDFWNTLAKDRAPVKVRLLSAERMLKDLKERGYRIELDQMMKAFAECRKVCYRYQEDLGIDFTPEHQVKWICEYFKVDVDKELGKKMVEHYTTSLLDIPPLFVEGLKGILERLIENYKLAIICNTGRTPGWVIRKILSDSGLLHYFDVTSFSNELGIAKPNPEMFLITVKKLGVEAEQVIHIGDDTHTDIYGAGKAGLKTGWYNPEGLVKEVDCDLEIRHLNQVVELIENIRGE